MALEEYYKIKKSNPDILNALGFLCICKCRISSNHLINSQIRVTKDNKGLFPEEKLGNPKISHNLFGATLG
ncbi:hypothetical protein GO491_06430 [Flavobacteriaceae bacterium Ap0902]|nr:hypothetical protein [Flavobacteriaceae bacterium Ap0902]